MAKVEQQALAKAKQEYDNERRVLQQKMDAELTELQTQLKLFQKVAAKLNPFFDRELRLEVLKVRYLCY